MSPAADRGTSPSGVAVVGAGIAGLTTALALSRAGVDCVVLEEQETPPAADGWQGVILQHNAVRVFEELGLADSLEPLAARIERLEHRTLQGERIATWELGHISEELGGWTGGITRRNLERVLLDALPDGAVRFGAELAGVRDEGVAVELDLRDGSTVEAAILVGADGNHSAVRRLVFAAPNPRDAGYALWEGVALGPMTLTPGLQQTFWGRGARFTWYRVGGDGGVAWLANVRGTDDGVGRKNDLLRAFSGWPAPVEELIEATETNRVRKLRDYDRRPTKHWSRNRVTLVGEAAHPMTTSIPQGIAQATEDAIVLARQLREALSPEALGRFQSVRAVRSERIAMLARGYGIMCRWQGRPVTALRDRFLSVLFSTIGWKVHQKDMAYPYVHLFTSDARDAQPYADPVKP